MALHTMRAYETTTFRYDGDIFFVEEGIKREWNISNAVGNLLALRVKGMKGEKGWEAVGHNMTSPCHVTRVSPQLLPLKEVVPLYHQKFSAFKFLHVHPAGT